jgi:hypothetical protein
MSFKHGLAIGFGIITAFGITILAGAFVLYLITMTTHLDPVLRGLGVY